MYVKNNYIGSTMGSKTPQKRTLTIDDDTIIILKEYGNIANGSANVSAAIRTIARDWKFRSVRETVETGVEASNARAKY